MKKSDQINEIASALSAAQAEMTGAKKSSKNTFFKSNYADLASVMEAISAPFAAHGLSFIQSAGHADNGGITITTLLMHASGQWIESDPLTIRPVKDDPQAYGSAVTYAKRYSLQALVGVPSVDDDGNAATQPAQHAQQHAQQRRQRMAEQPKQLSQDELATARDILEAGAEQGLPGLQQAWKELSAEQRSAMAQVKDNLKRIIINKQNKESGQ